MKITKDNAFDATLGSICYTADGQEVKLIHADDNGLIVELSHVDDDGDTYFDGIIRVSCVYDEPPVARYSEEAVSLKSEIAKLKEERNSIRAGLESFKRENAERIKKLKNVAALKRIEDFIDGKITHYVYERYGRIEVTTPQSEKCDCDKHDMRLLSLYGKSNGDLEWRLNKYSDNSGISWQVFPCTSLEEANEKALELIESLYDQFRKGKYNWNVTNVADSAKKLGLEPPQDIVEAIRDHELKQAKSILAETQKRYVEAKQKFDALTAAETSK